MSKARRKAANALRGSTGAFVSQVAPSGNDHSDDLSDNNTVAWEDDSEAESDADGDYSEQWQALPRPLTWEERAGLRLAQKEKAEKKRRVAEMRGAEQRLAGPMDNQKGKKRGRYNVGGPSKRSLQDKRKKLKADYEGGKLKIFKTEFDRQMAALKPAKSTSKPVKQQTLTEMFGKRARAISISSDSDSDEDSPPLDLQKRELDVVIAEWNAKMKALGR
ncbi:hypothetical protein C8R46DRAFT_1313726 [Mycena filopes]|nr:hypothetical protein C8R46DRAFT_1313726 [Mycena filopes]